ncbi:DNA double-strand break repair nuclease NurA [Geitlerinema sp. PCC 7407]|uniref:DNA double-strand break repair nuclease NurA n=1 Tax=Geitlerinema sp. PCC 7407 TaxID=1173025 RepID=UPI00029FE70D|nr:DNA double-strand break repair nuclease NurA [Geitlerinema sp. PCC 7407]AFY64975.1 NurA domain protein [Geitlerinema sp. PCC 7407]
MLDLTKLALQMQGMSQHLAQEAIASRQRLERVQQLLARAIRRQDVLVEQRREWSDRLGFAAAEPVEPLETMVEVGPAPALHSVVATDGSQMAPNHHEIAYCYLLNVGRVVLHYGQACAPLLDSLPEVVYRAEDLYLSRQWGVRTEEWMGYQRTVLESVVLADLVQEVAGSGAIASGSGVVQPSLLESSPCLAMVDGSLIYWFLEGLPAEARDRILPPILAAWEQIRQLGVPLVSYLSASRSTEALNFFRLESCPYANPDCATHCAGAVENAPCQVFSPLRDSLLWAGSLKPGFRGPLWRSWARILELYEEPQRIYFCYLHVGPEVARVEFPAWVAEDRVLLDWALRLTLAQVQKGYGYPVALAEAHNQAVVRGGDRARFFALLEQQMLRAGLQNIGISYKEARKRGSIA